MAGLKRSWLTGLMLMLLSGGMTGSVCAEPLVQPGAIERFRSEIQPLLVLSMKEGKLSLNREEWFRALGRSRKDYLAVARDELRSNDRQDELGNEELVNRTAESLCVMEVVQGIQTMSRAWSSSSSQGNDSRQLQFQLDGDITFRVEVQFSTGEFEFSIKNTKAPKDKIEISETPEELKIKVSTNNGQLTLKLTRTATGEISIEYEDQADGTHKTIEKPTLIALMESEANFLYETAYPFMEAMGITPPLGRNDPAVLDAAIALSIPVSQEMKDRIHELIYQLNDYDFDLRESASKQLSEYYMNYPEEIDAYMDQNWPAEVYSRLGDIARSIPRRNEAEEFAKALNLVKNLEFFLESLDRVNAERAPRLIRVLQILTGETFDTVDEWKAWAGQR